MSKKIETVVESLILDIVESKGFELADVEYKKEDGEYVLTAYIHSDKGVSIDDCEAVSRLIEPIIDEADPIEGQYFLSVSSVGLDRALDKPKDFQRNIGKVITVRLYAPINGKKEHRGVLVSNSDFGIIIKTAQGEMELKYDQVALSKLYIEF